MKSKSIRKSLASVTALAIAFGSFALTASSLESYDGYTSTDPLLAATRFHMFAQEKYSGTAHTHGNIAAKVANTGEFGTRNNFWIDAGYEENPEITYIRDIEGNGFSSSSQGGTLVLGRNWTVKTINDGAETFIQMTSPHEKTFKIDNNKFDKILIEGTNVNDPYIDLDAEFAKLRKLSSDWSVANETKNVEINTSDRNNLYMDFSNVDTTKGYTYVNLDASDPDCILNIDTKLTIKGVDTNPANNGIVVINIDVAGIEAGENGEKTYINKNQSITVEGCTGNREVGPEEYGTSRIVFNFFDSSQSDRNFSGTVGLQNQVEGSLLAPSADVKIGAINGTVIGKNIDHSGDESHRRDIVAMGVTGDINLDPDSSETDSSSSKVDSSSSTADSSDSTADTSSEASSSDSVVDTSSEASSSDSVADTSSETSSSDSVADTSSEASSSDSVADTSSEASSSDSVADTSSEASSSDSVADTSSEASSSDSVADTSSEASSSDSVADTSSEASSSDSVADTSSEASSSDSVADTSSEASSSDSVADTSSEASSSDSVADTSSEASSSDSVADTSSEASSSDSVADTSSEASSSDSVADTSSEASSSDSVADTSSDVDSDTSSDISGQDSNSNSEGVNGADKDKESSGSQTSGTDSSSSSKATGTDADNANKNKNSAADNSAKSKNPNTGAGVSVAVLSLAAAVVVTMGKKKQK